jgi:chemotaxis protein CheD
MNPVMQATDNIALPPPTSSGCAVAMVGADGQRHVVGIGEFAVSDRPGDLIVTHALGSCIAVCLWDPDAKVAGLIHFLLPEARINPQRAADQPATFADTGIPLVFQAAYKLGAVKSRLRVRLVGGAEIAGNTTGGGTFNIGKRNLLAAKNVLWRNGVIIENEEVGGRTVRTVHLTVDDGRVQVSNGRDVVVTL